MESCYFSYCCFCWTWLSNNSHSIFLNDMRSEESSLLRKQVVLFSCPLTFMLLWPLCYHKEMCLIKYLLCIRHSQSIYGKQVCFNINCGTVFQRMHWFQRVEWVLFCEKNHSIKAGWVFEGVNILMLQSLNYSGTTELSIVCLLMSYLKCSDG